MKNTTGGVRYDPVLRIGMIAVVAVALIAAAASTPAVRIGVVDSKQVAAASKSIRGMINDAASTVDACSVISVSICRSHSVAGVFWARFQTCASHELSQKSRLPAGSRSLASTRM